MRSPVIEPDQPLTELCERAWKLLIRLGKQWFDRDHNDVKTFNLDCWYLRSHNRLLWIEKRLEPTAPNYRFNITPVFSVDEDGDIGSLDVLECAIALERFRQYTVLDDLAEV